MSRSVALPRASTVSDTAANGPLRLASIDVGSNAIRLLVGEFERPGAYRLLAQDRLPVRLGHDVYRQGELAPEMMERAIRALTSLRGQMQTLNVTRYRAVATSAVRESGNGDEFVARVRREAELELDVITGSEEARLVQLAVRSKIPFEGRRWAIVDVGGGSVEVVVVTDAGIVWSESHTMGTVRLLEEFDDDERGVKKMRRLMSEYAATLRLASKQRLDDVAGLIATGGNIEALARLAGAEPEQDGVSRVPVARLTALAEELADLTYEERVQRLDLREDRAT